MKVIKDNYKKFPKQVTCAECGSVILLEGSEDVYRAESFFETVWYCPLCQHKNRLEIDIP